MQRLSPTPIVADTLKIAPAPSPTSTDGQAAPSFGTTLARKMDEPGAPKADNTASQSSSSGRPGGADGGTKSADPPGTKKADPDRSDSASDAAAANGAKGRADATGKADKTAKSGKDGVAAPADSAPDPAIAALVAGHAAAVAAQKTPASSAQEKAVPESLPAASATTAPRADAATDLVEGRGVGRSTASSGDNLRAPALRPDEPATGGPTARGSDVSPFAASLDVAAAAPAAVDAARPDVLSAALERAGASPAAKAEAAADAVANTVQGAVQAQTLPIQAAATTEVRAALQVDTRVGARGFDAELGNRVVWMANSDHQTAELHLNPPDLGPLQVVLDVNRDQATAFFSSPHAEVRQAVEDALPKLREMFAQNGIQLGSADVGADPRPRQEQDGAAGRAGRASRTGRAQSGALAGVAAPVRRSGSGLVDTFA